MHSYSDLFVTVFDEKEGIARLGRGAHVSVLRAVLWDASAGPFAHDVAIVWDEDHDERVVWVAEELFVRRLLAHVLFIGERKGGVAVVVDETISAVQHNRLCTELEAITQNDLPSDVWPSQVVTMPQSGSLVQDEEARVLDYLRGVRALWQLGRKSLRRRRDAFVDPPL
jgi:hypothetical protein